MVSRATTKTLHQAAIQPGSIAKKWDKEELVRCCATGTETTATTGLEGQAHPIFANWIEAETELYKELEQPILLASRILEANGLPWLSDFLVDDIFGEDYPGREQNTCYESASMYEDSVAPHSIVRHHRTPWATPKKQAKWRRLTRNMLRSECPKLIQWQIDEDIFKQKGWNGYTCRHPRAGMPLDEIDEYETIQKFDRISLHKGSRNLTILLTAEYPARLAKLRHQGKARSEEYLLTAFMTTVRLGHAMYWKYRRSLRRDMREPFYGGDLEMELGDSFIAAIFGGWIPVPVRGLAGLRDEFSFADGVAWRQALNWDYHRLRPKYRAHYSIPVDYVARLFTEASWSTTSHKATALVWPRFLTRDSIALRTVGLCTTLTQANHHATAAIADFHCNGDGNVWNRRTGAWFRIPQYDGRMYPELEIPPAREYVVCEPIVKEHGQMVTTRHLKPLDLSLAVEGSLKDGEAGVTGARQTADEGIRKMNQEGKQEGSGDVLSLSLTPLSKAKAAAGTTTVKLSLRKSEYGSQKFAPTSPATKIPRPIFNRPPVPNMGASKPRKRTRAERQVSSEDENIPYARLGGCKEEEEDDNNAGSHDRSDISVDELKKRLSQLIGVSQTELERLFDGPPCRSAGVE
ncbi:hypothetical protein FHL15_000173 [Xylaria flabelliformis]|uniref:Uncharacterized protein n=1 Tax=Xylaria flabelliformis TaxID=2512241 RepID=A0A553IF56_9PEZI|nr:hypothetical protein FHL15_000173 [Xylaria flabelliformis]